MLEALALVVAVDCTDGNRQCQALGQNLLLTSRPAVLNFCLFLSAFAKVLKAIFSFVILVCVSVSSSARLSSVRLSVSPRGTTQLPMDGFVRNLVFGGFFGNMSRNFNSK